MLAPGPYWLDSSEFAAASFELGVAHPPGHPLAALLGKAFALLPLGPVALRVGLSQAACGALAAALCCLLAAELAGHTALALGRRDRLLEALAGAAAGLWLGGSHAAALQAVRPEVYALNAALVLLAALALSRFDVDGDPRRLLGAALALGLGLANHHVLTGLFGLAALAYVAMQHERLRPAGAGRVALIGAAAGGLGVLLYAYLPLRALAHPEVDWGAPSTAARFLWTVSARAFARSLDRAELGGAGAVALALSRELGPALLVTALGAWTAVRLPAVRRVGALLLLGAAVDAAAPALVGFDRDNPDAYGYLEPAVALLAVLGGAALGALGALSPRRVVGRLAAASALAWAGLAGAARLPALSLSDFADTARVGEAILDDCPSRALLVTSYYQTVLTLSYLRLVEGQRPDVDHLHRHFLPWPGYRDEVLRRLPALEPVLGPRDVDAAALERLAASRPVVVEYDLDLDRRLVERLAPGVLAESLVPPGAAPPAGPTPAVVAAGERLRGALDLGESETRRFVFWRAFLDAHRDCSLGRRGPGQAALFRARGLLGGTPDPDLEELAQRCGL